MAQLGAARVVLTPRGEGRSVRELLYKADYPRHIDLIIDFFGERRASAEAPMPCVA
jgi:hypothetical protein